MALDAALLKLICDDINVVANSSKVDKVFQPEYDEFIFVLRNQIGSYRLRISSSSASPAVYFTSHHKENPKQAPTLCMLLRKMFIGGRFIKAEQINNDRIIKLSFQCFDEMGDIVERFIVVEIMNRNSNIIFINNDGKIIDAVKRISLDDKTSRCILPGFIYKTPLLQNKKPIFEIDINDINLMLSNHSVKLCDLLLATISGISPIVCKEIAHLSTGDAFALSEEANATNVYNAILDIKEYIKNPLGFYVINDESINKSIDFTFFKPTFYDGTFSIKRYDNSYEMLDDFYYSRDKAERIKQKSYEINRVVSRGIERIIKRNSIQESELSDCNKADDLKIRGELITANIYRISPGDTFVSVENYYDNGKIINIPLDANISPQRNAQKYFKEYKKLTNRKVRLTEQLQKGYDELEWLRSVSDELSLADGENDISKIREELSSEGYIRTVHKKVTDAKKEKFDSILSDDGFTIFYGKNNVQNDQLTMKFASNNDIWFHARETFGSHVILKLNGREPTELAIFTAAKIAAKHSKSSEGTKIAVDYTEIKNVKKPKGSKPGKVFYVNFKTIIV